MEEKNKYSGNNYESSIRKHDKNVTTTKVWLFVTGFLFISSLALIIILLNFNQTAYDTAIYGTIVAVTGAIFGSNLCWYSKKSTYENQYKLRMSMYEDTVNQRLYFNEEMMKLMKKYEMTDYDIEKINNSGDIDEFMDDALSSAKDKLDESQNDSESPNELQQFSI